MVRRKQLIYVYLLIIALTVGVIIYRDQLAERRAEELAGADIKNFEDCVAAGYPVMDSFPEQCATADGRVFVKENDESKNYQDLIRVSSPLPNSAVESPLTVTGSARGTWFFEASFPVRLEDEFGRVIVQSYAQAQDEWMTEEFVPFSGTLEFNQSIEVKGRLVFEKDNPSGLPEHADEWSIPVIIKPSSMEQTSVNVFFLSQALADSTDCSAVAAVKKDITATPAPARVALETLIAGPTPAERTQGYYSLVPLDTTINSLTIEPNGTARADFSAELNEDAAGSCYVTALRSQIEQTLLQFSTVNNVIISVNGDSETILQP